MKLCSYASRLLAIQPFPYNSLWFAGIYVRGSIPKSFLVRVIMKVARNTVEGVKFIITTMVFCPCCGMALRMSPTNKRDRERLRQLQLRREEQDRIINHKWNKEVSSQSRQVKIK